MALDTAGPGTGASEKGDEIDGHEQGLPPHRRRARGEGKGARAHSPLAAHSGWDPAGDRPDPVALLEAQNLTREPDLVPVRHGRMMVSPFTFYRGAAKIMAADLKDTPAAGLTRPTMRRRPPVQLRRVRLAGADLDVRSERLRRDPARAVRVRRQAHGGQLHYRRSQQRLLRRRQPRATTLASVAAYREAMAEFAGMGNMEIWYAHLTEHEIMEAIRALAKGARPRGAGQAKEGEKRAQKNGGEVPYPRQPAGAVQAGRGGRRVLPDRQPAAGGDPRP